MARSELLHEYPCTHVPYEELMAELNKIKAKLPKSEWSKIYFQVETKRELGTYDEYQALCIYLSG